MFDLIDHPFISLLIFVLIVLGLCFGIGVLIYLLGNYGNPYNYKYTDIDDNEGYAQWCNHSENLNCYVNGGYVQVKEFHRND